VHPNSVPVNVKQDANITVSNVQGGAKGTHVFESACDFFLWGHLESKVYVRKPRTVDDLKVSIREEIVTVPQEMLNVMQNFVGEALDVCTARRTPSFRYNFPVIE